MSTAVAKREENTAVDAPHAPASQAAALFSMIERVAADPSVSVERVEQLFGLYQRMQADRAQKAFAAALVAAQTDMQPVAKDANNPQTKSRYATYDALDRALRPIYTKHGFAVSFNTEQSAIENHVRIICTVVHREGHERTYSIDMPCDGKGAKGGDVMTKTHAMASAITYGRRYLLASAFNIATTERDDDGNAAAGLGPKERITEEQAKELAEFAERANIPLQIITEHFKVQELTDLTPAQFKTAMNKVRKKLELEGLA